jgi:phosphate transport system permease protein
MSALDASKQRSTISLHHRRMDVLFSWLAQSAAWVVLALMAGILASLFIGAWPALKHFGIGFFFDSSWNPVTEKFGALSPIVGTLATASIALLIAVPLSFGIAIFLTELCPARFRTALGMMVELLASIPSIIYGIWGLLIFAPLYAEHVQPFVSKTLGVIPGIGVLFQGPPMGIGISTAGIILAFMVVPFIASVMRDVFEVVPGVLKESAYALGATRWEVVRNVVLPYAKVGVVGGIMLGLGRALGETMAVTFVIGNSYNLSPSLFEAGNSIASSLANEFAEATTELHAASLIALGLTLFFITLIVLVLARLLLARMGDQSGDKR